jgi:DNA gyrase/topoisomerase IV subunit A
MSKTLSKKELPRFDNINKYNVTIKSLRNKLKSAKGIDELTDIASKIIELENQILTEKTNGYKRLEHEKKQVEKKINKLQRVLTAETNNLQRIDDSLEFKLNGYRKKLQMRIDSLSDEYIMVMGYISSPSNNGSEASSPSHSLNDTDLAYTAKLKK